MDHDLELIIPILEILEIEVCSIIYKPRDIGNLIFSTSSYPGNIGKLSMMYTHIFTSGVIFETKSIPSPAEAAINMIVFSE